MFKLSLTEDVWRARFSTIHYSFPNDFQQGFRNHWLTHHNTNNNSVNAQAISWLFCWADLDKSQDVRQLFNDLFEFDYVRFRDNVGSDWAHSKRYAEGDFDTELEEML